MTRIITHLLILFVLFTHSVMAMDVHIPHDEGSHISNNIGESVEHVAHTSTLDYTDNTSQAPCADAGGHCSHHQAHTSGLLCISTLSYTDSKPVLFSQLKQFSFLFKQSPPRRPPKA